MGDGVECYLRFGAGVICGVIACALPLKRHRCDKGVISRFGAGVVCGVISHV